MPLLREGPQTCQILRPEIEALDSLAASRQAFPADAGIAWRAPHLRNMVRLGQLPDQRMLPPAGTDDEDSHCGIESGNGSGAKAIYEHSCWTIVCFSVNGTALNKRSYQTTMKNGLKLALAFGFGIALLQGNAEAQDKVGSKQASANGSATRSEEHTSEL